MLSQGGQVWEYVVHSIYLCINAQHWMHAMSWQEKKIPNTPIYINYSI